MSQRTHRDDPRRMPRVCIKPWWPPCGGSRRATARCRLSRQSGTCPWMPGKSLQRLRSVAVSVRLDTMVQGTLAKYAGESIVGTAKHGCNSLPNRSARARDGTHLQARVLHILTLLPGYQVMARLGFTTPLPAHLSYG